MALLDTKDGIEWVGGGLVLGWVANQTPLFGERDIGRSNEVALIIGEYFYLAIFHHGNTRVSRPQVLLTISLRGSTA